MPEQSNWDALVMPVLAPLASVVAALVIAWLLNLLLGRLARRLAQKAGTNFYGAILSAARWPIAAAIILVGVYQAALLSPWTGKWYPYMVEGFLTLLVLVGIFGAAAVLSAVLRWYAEEVAASARTRLSYVLAAALRIIVPLAAVALALLIGLEAMGIRSEPVNTWLLEHGGRTAFIIVLVLVALLVVEQAVPPMVASTLAWRREELEEEARKRTDTLARTLVTSVQVAAVLVAAFMVIAEVGVNIGPILAGVGIAGIAIGFGTQSLVRDFVGGFFIILENQYRIGDVVKVGEIAGLVEDLSLRRTVLRDLDGAVHSVPNGEIRVNSNFTREWSRVNLNVAVAYSEDVDRVIAVINRVGLDLAQDPEWASLILTPPQALGVDYLSDTAIEIKILGDTKPIRQWEVMGELRKRLKKTFDQEGIEVRASQQGLLRQLALPRQVQAKEEGRERRGQRRKKSNANSGNVLDG